MRSSVDVCESDDTKSRFGTKLITKIMWCIDTTTAGTQHLYLVHDKIICTTVMVVQLLSQKLP